MLRKIILILVFLWLSTIDVHGKEYICSWYYDENNNIQYTMEEIDVNENLNVEQKVVVIFDKFFNRCDNSNINLIPEGTEFIAAKLNQNHLDLYVSSEIKSYGGGSAWELALVKAILDTAFNIDEVDTLTLYIDGKIDFLPEGTIIDNYRKEDYLIENNICYQK